MAYIDGIYAPNGLTYGIRLSTKNIYVCCEKVFVILSELQWLYKVHLQENVSLEPTCAL